ncbi:hypothetical protein MPTK1_8g17360 [Marchantia polymorpha subsp. ruderalis]|uniref:Fungal lipase-type domain-containing protein n=1 Tax=Marchantia polymorpha TaxID=3197 RepID=A0A2R6X8A5_MARPO|nr:hypothetical protein MARPO_0030s0070 [Marchantia polymorpha]BBN20210.1 hypothetical protein Mp_8g17360 [Marchantia polymorpha subsp. ruderalis]|eukprot:PTQ42328.1 hypothetical protein MARPO_0030s0070 [Marchantia polymorpha]
MGLALGLGAIWKSIIAVLLVGFRSPGAEEALQSLVPQRFSHGQSRDCLYNRTLALYVVEYAAAVYVDDPAALMSWTCSRCQGLTSGFQITELIVDVPHCLQAYVGVAEDLKAIVIAFRGTQETSYQNWAEDLYFRQLDLNYPGIEDAMVHSGFYSAYHNTTLRDSVVRGVLSILARRNDLGIIVTGHSMGGAMATLCALDLAANFGMIDMKVITFGQPRIGNSVFAAGYYALVPNTVRMTHAHDIVPHLPPYYTLLGEKTYHHFATEVWIFKIQVGRLQYEFEQVCDSSGEDPECSRSVTGNSISDHLQYLGVYLKTVDE